MSKLMRKKKIDFELDETVMNIFNTKIEDIHEQCDTYTEAIVSYCEEHDVEIEDIIPLISNGLKEKMYIEEVALRNISKDTDRVTEDDIFL